MNADAEPFVPTGLSLAGGKGGVGHEVSGALNDAKSNRNWVGGDGSGGGGEMGGESDLEEGEVRSSSEVTSFAPQSSLSPSPTSQPGSPSQALGKTLRGDEDGLKGVNNDFRGEGGKEEGSRGQGSGKKVRRGKRGGRKKNKGGGLVEHESARVKDEKLERKKDGEEGSGLGAGGEVGSRPRVLVSPMGVSMGDDGSGRMLVSPGVGRTMNGGGMETIVGLASQLQMLLGGVPTPMSVGTDAGGARGEGYVTSDRRFGSRRSSLRSSGGEYVGEEDFDGGEAGGGGGRGGGYYHRHHYHRSYHRRQQSTYGSSRNNRRGRRDRQGRDVGGSDDDDGTSLESPNDGSSRGAASVSRADGAGAGAAGAAGPGGVSSPKKAGATATATTTSAPSSSTVGPSPSVSGRVVLDVGGVKYVTSRSTLVHGAPESMLAAMFDESRGHNLVVEPDGSYFIDRNGTHFGTLLEYLRNGEVDPALLPEDRRGHIALLREASFFQVTGLIEALEERGDPEEAMRAEDDRQGAVREAVEMIRNHVKEPDFSGLDLSGADFSWLTFDTPALFRGCNLTGASFSRAVLQAQIDFTGANLRNVRFDGTEELMFYAIFTDADLRGAHLSEGRRKHLQDNWRGVQVDPPGMHPPGASGPITDDMKPSSPLAQIERDLAISPHRRR